MSASPGQIGRDRYEFGPFRLDPEKQTLLRDDKPIALTPKAFQLLLVLVRRSNQVVTKDELMKSVWPDTFVEETNLTRNIFALRRALGETEQDRYIITVPGEGYRFAENVHNLPERQLDIVAATQSTVQVRIAETRSWRWIAPAVIVLLAAAGGTSWFFTHRKPILTERDTVVLADFANSTGDSVFDGTLRQGMAVQLEQSPFLSLISEERIRRTLVQMGQSADAPLSGETAREVCERTGAVAVIEGSIAALGSEYVLGLGAKNCRTGDILDEEQGQAAKKEDVLKTLGAIATKFRTRIGESLTTVEKYSRPLEEATSSSLEALKAYNTGLNAAFSSGLQAGIPFLRRAVELDSQFAMAHAHMGLMYISSGESELAVRSLSKAYQLRDRVSDRERFFIDTSYHRAVTGNLEKAIETCELWALTYPRDGRPHSLLSGFLYQGLGKYEASLEEAQQALGDDPDVTPSYANLAFSYFYLGRFDEAQATAQRAFERKLYMPELSLLQYHIAFLKGDRARMEQERSSAQGRAGAEDWINHLEALALAQSGQLRAAREMSQLAVESARHAGNRERAATFEVGVAVWEALFGNGAASRQYAMAGLALSKSRDIEYAASFALAVSGDFPRSQALMKVLEKQFPNDTSVRFSYLPVLRSLSALHRNEPDAAIEQLRIAAPYELAQTRIGFFGFFGNLYPAYVRGQAFLAENRAAEAAAELQKILDHRGIVVSDPIGALARLQLARAYVLSGDPVRAKSAYQGFLTLWKDADPGTPLLMMAETEYTRLQ